MVTVDSPKWYGEPPHGWGRNLKLTIKKPIDDAQLVGRLRWWFLKRQSKSWPEHEMALFWVPSRSPKQTIKNPNQERGLIAQPVEVRDPNPKDNV